MNIPHWTGDTSVHCAGWSGIQNLQQSPPGNWARSSGSHRGSRVHETAPTWRSVIKKRHREQKLQNLEPSHVIPPLLWLYKDRGLCTEQLWDAEYGKLQRQDFSLL